MTDNTIVAPPKNRERFDPLKAHVHFGSPWPAAVAGWTEVPGYLQRYDPEHKITWYRSLMKTGTGPEDTKWVIRDSCESHGVPMSFLFGPMDIYEAFATAPYLFPSCFEPITPEGTHYEVYVVEHYEEDSGCALLDTFPTSLRDADNLAAYHEGGVACRLPSAPLVPLPDWIEG